MFNFLQDLVVVANCLPYIACLWTPLPPTVYESSAIKDIKQKLSVISICKAIFSENHIIPHFGIWTRNKYESICFHEQKDLGYHICWKAPSIGYHICILFQQNIPSNQSSVLFASKINVWVSGSSSARCHWWSSCAVLCTLGENRCIVQFLRFFTSQGRSDSEKSVEGERKTHLSKWGTPHIPLKYIVPFK